MALPLLTYEEVSALVNYDPLTGEFTSTVTKRGHQRGNSTGYENACGYRRVKLAGKYYQAHRVAWLMVYKTWPNIIDHIDGNRSNNRIANLRDVCVRVNNQNWHGAQDNNVSGVLGVTEKKNGKYVARINTTLAGHVINLSLGVYGTSEEAHAVYLDAKRLLHVGCTI